MGYLGSFELYLSDISDSSWWNYPTPCATYTAPAEPGPFEVTCVGTGRYLVLRLPGPKRQIVLREVQLYDPPSNEVPSESPTDGFDLWELGHVPWSENDSKRISEGDAC